MEPSIGDCCLDCVCVGCYDRCRARVAAASRSLRQARRQDLLEGRRRSSSQAHQVAVLVRWGAVFGGAVVAACWRGGAKAVVRRQAALARALRAVRAARAADPVYPAWEVTMMKAACVLVLCAVAGCGGGGRASAYSSVAAACIQQEETVVQREGTTAEDDQRTLDEIRKRCDDLLASIEQSGGR